MQRRMASHKRGHRHFRKSLSRCYIATIRSSEMSLRQVHCAGLVGQQNTQQRSMDFEMPVVINEAQFAELVHEVTHARPSRADHLSEHFLTYLGENWAPVGLPFQNWPTAATAVRGVFRLS